MTKEIYDMPSIFLEEPKFVNADLHNHLATSSKMREGLFNKVANITRKRLGPHGIVGVVNFGDHRYEDLASQIGYERQDIGNAVYVPSRKVLLVKGQEVPTQQGHLLVLGIPSGTHLTSGRSLEDTIKEARDLNGIVIADHPFYHQGIGQHLIDNPNLITDLDAIETFNGEASFGVPPLPLRANERAKIFWKGITLYSRGLGKNKLGAISSSDGHSLYEIGKSYTQVKMPSWTSDEELSRTLRESINSARPEKGKTNTLTGFIGAIDHIADLAVLEIARKLGLNPKIG